MTYEQWLMVANLILYLRGEPLEDDYRCSRCGSGVPCCADLPGEPGDGRNWHYWTCTGFKTEMPLCWQCEKDERRWLTSTTR